MGDVRVGSTKTSWFGSSSFPLCPVLASLETSPGTVSSGPSQVEGAGSELQPSSFPGWKSAPQDLAVLTWPSTHATSSPSPCEQSRDRELKAVHPHSPPGPLSYKLTPPNSHCCSLAVTLPWPLSGVSVSPARRGTSDWETCQERPATHPVCFPRQR